jgi:sialate O-acetylesterase
MRYCLTRCLWLALVGAAIFLNLPPARSAGVSTLKLASIFGDNMVLQQNLPVPVWGWAAPGTAVTVTFSGQKKSTHADVNGRWEIRLNKLKASSVPEDLMVEVVESGERKAFKSCTNILVGEVWLASGQSNMEKPIGRQRGQKPVFNAEQELAAADNYPNIRLFQVEKSLSATPLDTTGGSAVPTRWTALIFPPPHISSAARFTRT